MLNQHHAAHAMVHVIALRLLLVAAPGAPGTTLLATTRLHGFEPGCGCRYGKHVDGQGWDPFQVLAIGGRHSMCTWCFTCIYQIE